MKKYQSSLLKKFLQKEIELVQGIDEELHNKRIRRFIIIATELGSSLVIMGLLILYAILIDRRAIFIIAPIYIFQLFIVELIKLIINRSRPISHKPKKVFGHKILSGSFPSGHTSNVFALAFLFSNYYATNTTVTSIFFAIAGLVGLSRIVLGKHFIGDVTGGAAIGVSLAYIGGLIAASMIPLLPI